MSRVSVIIVSWQVRERLRKCLQSLRQAEPLEIIVVDNNSQDGSAEMVKQEFPEVKLLLQSVNLGFARASNLGLRQASGAIMLLLNPDTQLEGGCLNQAEQFFNHHPRAGVVGGRLVAESGELQRSVRRLPRFWSQLSVMLKLGHLWPPLLNHYLVDDFNYHTTQTVEQVSGAFFFIRRGLVKTIGYLDESYWLWFEEVDFCKRTLAAGWQVWYAPQLKAQHLGGASFSQLTHLARQRQFNKSLRHYFKTHGQAWQYLLLLVASPISLLQAIILDLTDPRT